MNEIVLHEPENRGFKKAFDYCKKWGGEHQAEVGVLEMALGTGIIAWAVQNGYVNFGTDIVGTEWSGEGLIGGALGAGIGGIGASILGSVGVVAGGTAFGIPAMLLVGGGSLILGAAGYGIGDLAQKFLPHHSGFSDFLSGAAPLAIGMALIIDGARRVLKDVRVLQIASNFKDGVIHLVNLTTKVIAKTLDEFKSFVKELAEHPVSAGASIGGAGAAGLAIGGSLAAGSVTVLGSSGLGAAALSLGLVSAPLWPVIAGGAAGIAIGVAAWKCVTFLFSDDDV